jgi:hypothetical protein
MSIRLNVSIQKRTINTRRGSDKPWANPEERTMGTVKKITYKDKEIIYCDYRNCSEEEMIQLLDQGQAMILHDNHKTLQLGNITHVYATPKFMAHAKEIGKAIKHLTQKEAIVGITGAKKVLFTAYNLLMGGVARAFDTARGQGMADQR